MASLETLETPARTEPGPSTLDELLTRVRAAVPVLRERSAAIEQARQLPADVVALLRDTGAFRVAAPVQRGGLGLTSVEQTLVIEELAKGDSSAAWCAMIGMDTPIYAGLLDPAVAAELFPSPDAITAGLILPLGRADRVPGGYRVNGRWAFGSGITHADWVVAGALVHSDGEPERNPRTGEPLNWRIMLARPDQFEVLDTWHTTGLAGSGSRDYQAVDLFVPEEHSFTFAEPRGAGPLSTPDAILRNMPGVPLGIARAALDFVRDLAATRVDRTVNQPWPENYRVQTTIAEAEMELLGAREAVYGTLTRQWEQLQSGAQPSPDERVAPVLARVNSFRVARSVVTRLYDLVATTAIYRPSPLDRWLRDLITMRQHVIAQDQVLQSAGAHLLGGTPVNPFSLGIVE